MEQQKEDPHGLQDEAAVSEPPKYKAPIFFSMDVANDPSASAAMAAYVVDKMSRDPNQAMLIRQHYNVDTSPIHSLISACDAALQYIAHLHGHVPAIAPLSTAMTCKGLSDALKPFKSRPGVYADKNIVEKLFTTPGCAKEGERYTPEIDPQEHSCEGNPEQIRCSSMCGQDASLPAPPDFAVGVVVPSPHGIPSDFHEHEALWRS